MKIQSDADVFGNILVKSIAWMIAETAVDPEFDPSDECSELLEQQTFIQTSKSTLSLSDTDGLAIA